MISAKNVTPSMSAAAGERRPLHERKHGHGQHGGLDEFHRTLHST
jgi:hypothetical protein